MLFKLYVIALLGACVVQVTFAQSQVADSTKLIENLTQRAKDAVAKVTTLIKDKVKESLQMVYQLKDKILGEVSETTVAVTRQLKVVIGNSRRLIKPVIEKASSFGIDIVKCALNSDGRFLTVLKGLLQDGIQCITKEVKSALQIIRDSISTLKDAAEGMISLTRKLSECGASIACLGSVIFETNMLELRVPVKITSVVFETNKLITGLNFRLPICAGIQLSRAGVQTAKIISGVTKCLIYR